MYLAVSCSWDDACPPTSRFREQATVGSWLCDYGIIPKISQVCLPRLSVLSSMKFPLHVFVYCSKVMPDDETP